MKQLTRLSEPLLLFGHGQAMEDPSDGLTLFGPFDTGSVFAIRTGVVGTSSGIEKFKAWTQRIKTLARTALLQKEINSNLAGVTSSVDIFSEPGTVTFTGIFRAKRNEAAMVYVINAQDCFTSLLPRDVARVRNRLFTAITRSKAWVRVIGVGAPMAALKTEFEKTKAANFELRFTYPTEAERKQITIVNRDMSKSEQALFDKKRTGLLDIIESLESGETFVEDYPEEVINKLRALLNKKPE
jgi:superfamily I DNA and RNA helicase